MNDFVPLACMVGSITLTLYIGGLFLNRSKERVCDYNVAQSAMQKHYNALEKLIDDPATTSEMIFVVEVINTVLSNREFAHSYFDAIRNNTYENMEASGDQPSHSKIAFSQALELVESRPDIAKAFIDAIEGGYEAIFYRWPENKELYYSVFGDVVQETKKIAETDMPIKTKMITIIRRLALERSFPGRAAAA